jgi:hypothetical protein
MKTQVKTQKSDPTKSPRRGKRNVEAAQFALSSFQLTVWLNGTADWASVPDTASKYVDEMGLLTPNEFAAFSGPKLNAQSSKRLVKLLEAVKVFAAPKIEVPEAVALAMSARHAARYKEKMQQLNVEFGLPEMEGDAYPPFSWSPSDIEAPPQPKIAFLEASFKLMRPYLITKGLVRQTSDGKLLRASRCGPENPYPDGETLAAHTILEMAERGTLHLIRVCVCGKWYVATRRDNIACCKTHGQRIADQTAEAKEKRREKNRHNREIREGKHHFRGGKQNAKP